jgi:NAD(P)-dependent dehydrogenase (short-subunit alcohol dehydrogenase family)
MNGAGMVSHRQLSCGLGHAIVEAGLAAGNKVLATARDIKSLADLSERYGDQVKPFAMDVTDEVAAANAVKAWRSLRTDLKAVFLGVCPPISINPQQRSDPLWKGALHPPITL